MFPPANSDEEEKSTSRQNMLCSGISLYNNMDDTVMLVSEKLSNLKNFSSLMTQYQYEIKSPHCQN